MKKHGGLIKMGSTKFEILDENKASIKFYKQAPETAIDKSLKKRKGRL